MTKKELENIKNELKEYVANYLQVVDKNGNPAPQPEVTIATSDTYSYGLPPYGSMSVGSGSPPRIVHSIDEPKKAPSVQSMLNDLKKELDNSKFGAQCSIHELEYDKKTLIKENEKLTNLLNEVIGLADLMSDEINKNWCKESKLAVGKLNLIIKKSGWIRP